MNVIITGGTGLIGSYLTRTLIDAGHHVTLLTRKPNQRSAKHPNVDIVGWDARTPEGWGHLVNKTDAIVNLAGEDISGPGFFPARWTEKRKERIRSSRILAGRAVTQAVQMATHRPAVVVQSSGVGVYGDTGNEVITESHPFGDDFMARLGRDWEASTQAVEAMGVRRVIVRTAVNLSLESGALPRLLLPFRLYAGGPFGSGKQYLPWIHPRDEAEAILFLIKHTGASGAFNLAAPQAVTNSEFGKTLARLLKRPFWLPVPGFAMRLAFGEVADVVLTGQRAVPERLQEMGYSFRYPQLEQALTDILHEPQPVETVST